MSGLWVFKNFQVVQLDQSYAAFDFEHQTVIPLKAVQMQTLWVEKGRLVKNEYQPKWLKK